MKYTATERFIKYVQVDTQANPYSDTSPSTEKQIDLTKILCQELDALGISYETTSQGYIYASLPGNIDRKTKTVFFCAHIDTAFDCSGTNVKPIVHKNYQGGNITLPDDTTQIISTAKFPELKNKIGHDIITASGLTLLGADDKSGLATIMDALHQLVNEDTIKHGDVKVLFTTDEEIGRGVAHVDIEKIGADFGYTLDSGDVGNFEYENFSADSAILKIKGVSAHPGYAKGKMEHATRIAGKILAKLPLDHLSPESTENKQGFIHPTKVEGMLEEATIEFMLRDFETAKLKDHADMIRSIAEEVLKDFPNSSYTLETSEQYRNMKDIIDNHKYIVDIALQAMKNSGIDPNVGAIRGGTDGAMLSHKGLPCPNIFSGQHGIHSKLEWTTSQDMNKAVDTILEIIKLVPSYSNDQ